MTKSWHLDAAFGLGLLAVVLVSTLFAHKLTHRLRGQVQHHNQTATELRQHLSMATEHVQRLRQAQGVARQYREAFDERALAVEDVGPFLDRIERTAAHRGVQLTDLRQPPASGDHPSATPLILACRGGFAEVHAFLYDLENNGPVVRVGDLTLTADRPAGDCALSMRADILTPEYAKP